MNNQVTFEDLIVKIMPFPIELINWCRLHKEFQSALKIIYSEKFIHLGAVILSYPPNHQNDEVIGIITYDYMRKNPIFKQDFIINKESIKQEFILYTRNKKEGSSKYVKDINEFYLLYGKDGNYLNTHHLTFEQLDQNLKESGMRAINLANKIGKGQFVKPEQNLINKINNEFLSLDENNKYIFKKLKTSQ